MLSITVDGKTHKLLANGRLANLDEWTEALAKALAKQDQITLNQKHLEVLQVMREYYRQYNISPIMKLLRKTLAEQCGAEKAEKAYLDDLFPRNVLIQGTRWAGIPMPQLDAELDHSTQPAQSTPAPQAVLEFEGKQIPLHASGNLVHLEDWNERLAQVLAQQQDIQLNAEHWQIIHFLRCFYFDYGITPMVKMLKKHIAEKIGKDKASDTYLYQLFPGGPSRQGSRIAGLPEPQGCIDP